MAMEGAETMADPIPVSEIAEGRPQVAATAMISVPTMEIAASTTIQLVVAVVAVVSGAHPAV